MAEVENIKRPYLSITSIIFLVISLPIAQFSADIIGPKEDLFGYAALGILFIVLIIMLFLGLILGVASIYRNEQPKILSYLAPILNSTALFWLIWLLMDMPS
jgi:hypothetical protein